LQIKKDVVHLCLHSSIPDALFAGLACTDFENCNTEDAAAEKGGDDGIAPDDAGTNVVLTFGGGIAQQPVLAS